MNKYLETASKMVEYSTGINSPLARRVLDIVYGIHSTGSTYPHHYNDLIERLSEDLHTLTIYTEAFMSKLVKELQQGLEYEIEQTSAREK